MAEMRVVGEINFRLLVRELAPDIIKAIQAWKETTSAGKPAT